MSNTASSRVSRIADTVRAELFEIIGREDDGKVGQAIAILITLYKKAQQQQQQQQQPVGSATSATYPSHEAPAPLEAQGIEYDDDWA